MRALLELAARRCRRLLAVSTVVCVALLNAGAIGSMVLLGGCGANSWLGNLTASQLQTDVGTIASGLSGIVNSLKALPGNLAPSADVIAKVETEIALIQSNAATIATSLAPSTATLQAIAGGVSTVAALLTPFFPAAPAIGAVVQAAVALISVVLTSTGVNPPAAAARTFAAVPVRYTPDEARLILLDAAKSGAH